MRNVLITRIAQPAAYSATARPRSQPVSTDHTVVGQRPPLPQQQRRRPALAASTNVLRSIAGGTNRVHQRLNHGRAMTLCWTANRLSSATSISDGQPGGAGRAVVDALGHADVRQEADRVDERREEREVRDRAVAEDQRLAGPCCTSDHRSVDRPNLGYAIIRSTDRQDRSIGDRSDSRVREHRGATATQILEAARSCLLADGYANLSTRKVADGAGVPLSQIHYHFGGKRGMVARAARPREPAAASTGSGRCTARADAAVEAVRAGVRLPRRRPGVRLRPGAAGDDRGRLVRRRGGPAGARDAARAGSTSSSEVAQRGRGAVRLARARSPPPTWRCSSGCRSSAARR